MANLLQLFMKRRFQGSFTTNCFLAPSSFQAGQRFGPPHKSLLSSSCTLNNNNGASVTHDYDKVTNLNDALKSFNIMIQKRPLPSVVNFTRLLHDVTELKYYSCSLHLFKQMCALGVPVNTCTAGIAIKCYRRLYRTKYGLAVLGFCFKKGVELHVSAYNALLKGFVLNNTHLAESLFCDFIARYRLCELNLVSYKVMIKGLCKIGNNFTAIGLLRLIDYGILDGGCKFDVGIYNIIFDSLCKDKIYIDHVFKLLREMVFHKGIPLNVHTYNSLIYNLSKLGRWDEVCKMLKQMEDKKISPNLKTFNIIVDALCKQRKADEAQVVVDIMIENGDGKYPPNVVTYNSLIDGYCWRLEMTEARRIYDSLASKCIKPTFVTQHTLLIGYYNFGKYDECIFIIGSVGYTSLNDSLSYLTSSDRIDNEFPTMDKHFDILDTLMYEEALAYFHMMDGSGLNIAIPINTHLICKAILHRRFDDVRRHYHNMIVKGVVPRGFATRLICEDFTYHDYIKKAYSMQLTKLVYYPRSLC